MATLAASIALMLLTPTGAQTPAPLQPAQFDPSDVYFQGYLATRSAEQLEASGDHIAALEKLQKANQLFSAVAKYYPEWKPEMVKGRTEKTTESIAQVRAKADDQLKKNRNEVAELEGGVKKSGKTIDPAEGVVPLTPKPDILKVDPLQKRRLDDAEAEVKRLRDLAAKEKASAQASDYERQRDSSRLRDVERQRNALQAELQAAQNNLQSLRSRLAAAPMEKDVKDLNQRIDAIEQERQAMAMALSQSRSAHDEAAAGIAALQADLKAMQQKRDDLERELKTSQQKNSDLGHDLRSAQQKNSDLDHDLRSAQQKNSDHDRDLRNAGQKNSDLDRDLKSEQQKNADLAKELRDARQRNSDLDRDIQAERKVANSVVAGQRRQLEALEKELEGKNIELTKANEHIKGLMNQLQESQDAFTQIKTERDSLMQERDQMSALLKLNEAGRIQDLIEQNMALAKNLREANEKVDRLNRESNADKDATIDALRDLAIAKSQINRLHQEKRDQDKRIADLESRLKSEEAELAKGKASADPAEVEVLRDIIKRQLRVQERRRQARDLLVEAAKDLGGKDKNLANAIELFDTQEIALSPEEQKLVDNKKVDGEFVSPFARDPAVVGKASSELNREISVYERTAEKSFVAGRLLPSRELYQMILAQNPGHTPSLCKLGVVHLRLDDPAAAVDTFRRAVELDPNNPYAFRMLGFSLMKLGDIPGAVQAVRHSVDLSPTDAKSQMLLATLCYRLGHTGEAESYFKAAITADPVPSEPYYNLALLCSRDHRMEDANNYYQQALERGALPDPALEEKLSKK